ncbi:hypothetical protein [Nocardia gamkensis]|uniref:hypothetical protein n=1 Tax=Nocardia gamkensis TaxID=352869 RepID=UPI0037CCACFF
MLVILAMAALVLAPFAYADSGQSVSIISHLHSSNDLVPDTATCALHDNVSGTALKATGHVRGVDPADNYRGTGSIWMCLYEMPDGSLFSAGKTVDQVSISGCGDGTLSYTFSGPISAPDPLTGHRTTDIGFTVIPGSGTEDLKGITGTATSVGDIDPELNEDALFTGTLHCKDKDK